jgi:hypothetical protein
MPYLDDKVLSFDEFYSELKHLGLQATYFDWWEYRDALASHLEIEIEVKFVYQQEEPILSMLLTQEGHPGLLFRDDQTRDALILISGHLTQPATLLVIYHELGHVAGGHQYYKQSLSGGLPEDPTGPPLTGIAGKTAPPEKSFCENDARLRAEYALQASHYGREDYRTDDWFFW